MGYLWIQPPQVNAALVLCLGLLLASTASHGSHHSSSSDADVILRRSLASSRRLLQSNIPGMPGSVAGRTFNGAQGASATSAASEASAVPATSASSDSSADAAASAADSSEVSADIVVGVGRRVQETVSAESALDEAGPTTSETPATSTSSSALPLSSVAVNTVAFMANSAASTASAAANSVASPLAPASASSSPGDASAVPRPDRQLQGGGGVLNGAFQLNGPTNFAVNRDDSVSISLSASGGSGFTSSRAYSFGKFSVDAKMPAGYSAGVCACFFLISGDYNSRGEWDFEFLGSATDGTGMTLQTNYFQKGAGKHEELVSFGFDPSADFHTYTIDWQPSKTTFWVDGKAVRTVEKADDTFPSDPMTVAVSIWDASDWATGTYTNRIPVDYSKAPFTATFRNFQYTAY